MTGFSLALLRHRLQAARDHARQPKAAIAPAGRPDARLVWSHSGAGANPAGVRTVLERLARAHGDLRFLTTGQGPHPDLTAVQPPDTSAAARAFLDHWSPDIAVFSGADTFPLLWSEGLSRGIPLFAADVDTTRHSLSMIEAMRKFDSVLSRAPESRLGPVVEAVGPLSTAPVPPPARHSEVEGMATALANRPIWLAHDPVGQETGMILGAHRHAARMAHRLVLVLCTTDPAVDQRLSDDGWHWCRCETAQEVQSDTQIIVTEPELRMGLWLRLAPVTYLGGTLAGKGAGMSPRVPMALGSALVHGGRLGNYAAEIEPLRAANATCLVRDESSLGDTVERLLNPAEAAGFAARGWEATSAGSVASARLFELLDDTLAGIPA